MSEEGALVEHIPDIRAAEIQADGNAWISTHTVPEGKKDHILNRLLVFRQGYAVDRHDQEMKIVDMERVVFRGTVLDGPILDRPLCGDESGGIVGAEKRRSGARAVPTETCTLGEVKVRRTERVIGVL